MLKETSCLGVQDDIGEGDWGKPVYIDQTDYSTLHIIFTSAEESVDLRDLVTGQKIKKGLNKYLVKVEPLSVMRDVDYFMKCVKECEVNRLEDIDRMERGEAEE